MNLVLGRVLFFRLRMKLRRTAGCGPRAGRTEQRWLVASHCDATLAVAVGPAILFACALVASAQSSGSSVWDGVFSDEQAKRGEAAYLTYCASCHGSALEGADVAPSLVGGTFTSNWNDLTVGDLYERIRTTMPLDSPGKLSRQQNADVIAFLLKMNTWPSGASELAPDAGALKQVKIETNKRP